MVSGGIWCDARSPNSFFSSSNGPACVRRANKLSDPNDNPIGLIIIAVLGVILIIALNLTH